MLQNELLRTVWLSVKIGCLATLLNLPPALGFSWWMTRHRFKGKVLLDGLVNLPLVMPPVTIGYLLLLLLGKKGLLGAFLYQQWGIRIAFTFAAAVIAAMVISFPLMTRSIRVSMEMADRRLEQAAHTLGAGRWAVFFRITLPLILPGLVGGTVLGFARALGEFGATITFAGNIAGVSRSIPLAVYSLLQVPGKEVEAGILVGVSIVISFLSLLASSLFNRSLMKKRGALNGPHV